MNWTPQQVARLVNGHIRSLGDSPRVQLLSTDTRTLKPGELFVPLVGDAFDGHRFVVESERRGAIGALVQIGRMSESELQALSKRFLVILVCDTLHALGNLAADVRRGFQGPVVAITGSNGKTTTKEMVAGILEQRGCVLKNEGNFNNLVGLPLTLFRLGTEHRFAVLEMGANNFGEIRRLMEIARPTVGMITNVDSAHLEGFGDLDGVARAKGEMIEQMSDSGAFAVNLDDPRVASKAARFRGRLISFSRTSDADVRLIRSHPTSSGLSELLLRVGRDEIRVRLNAAGEHIEQNALAATAAAYAAGADSEAIRVGLESFRPVRGRSRILTGEGGIRILDDTYNANPASMSAALKMLARVRGKGRAIAVLGHMAELGPHAEAAHRELGAQVADLGVYEAFFVGPYAESAKEGAVSHQMSSTRVHVFESLESLIDELKKLLQEDDVVLVKGSRTARMERVVNTLAEGY
ncbi:MAG: UDP-N-acetylmuramoyl-tripeptide--D-alanyl-D-alanine ligase [Deltaproteobacteria bacterium]|nr:UDP-N-acetylmuramoyl-tripeptide--D-alanyl-D-alanine ligase [Deltaproteobacteria bacterium]